MSSFAGSKHLGCEGLIYGKKIKSLNLLPNLNNEIFQGNTQRVGALEGCLTSWAKQLNID